MINDRFYSSAASAGVKNGDMSIIGLISSADIVSKLVFLVLVLISLVSWAIIFDKIRAYKKLKDICKRFENQFYSGEDLEKLYNSAKKHKTAHWNPVGNLLIAAMEEWRYFKKSASQGSAKLSMGVKDRISKTLEQKISAQSDKLTSNLGFLATAGSVSPFIGLFGTVWGIMHSFQSIAYSQNTNLAVVAPGIAEALLATAIGLFVAIPAVVAYNYLTSQANKLLSRIDEFAEEVYAVLSRAVDEES
jgi:biopolymer transport protein TolQ